MNTPSFALLAQASTVPGLEPFLALLQTVSILIGISFFLFGAFQAHQGRVSEAILSIIAGFLSCVTVPVVRLIGKWGGLEI